MKNIFFSAFLLMISPLSFACGLDYENSYKHWLSRIVGPKAQYDVVKISQLEKVANHKTVYLNGIISKKVEQGVYKFRDQTGAININISDKVRQGRTFKSSERLYFLAKIEHKSCGSISIDVTEIKSKLS